MAELSELRNVMVYGGKCKPAEKPELLSCEKLSPNGMFFVTNTNILRRMKGDYTHETDTLSRSAINGPFVKLQTPCTLECMKGGRWKQHSSARWSCDLPIHTKKPRHYDIPILSDLIHYLSPKSE